jgi:pimaricinolide synthase PimS1
MSAELGDADIERMNRLGLPAMSVTDCLALFDQALGVAKSVLAPIRLDLVALRARTDEVPAVLRGLARGRVRELAQVDQPALNAASLDQRLASLAEAEQDRVLLELVCRQIATVLRHLSPDTVGPDRAFKELGFDSLAAVEVRNLLNAATGLRLPVTLMFDYPTSRAVAQCIKAAISARLDAADRG